MKSINETEATPSKESSESPSPADADKKYLEAVEKFDAELKKVTQVPDMQKIFDGASFFLEEYNAGGESLESVDDIKYLFTENKNAIETIVAQIKRKNIKNLEQIKNTVSNQLEASKKAVVRALKNVKKTDKNTLQTFAQTAQSFVNVYNIADGFSEFVISTLRTGKPEVPKAEPSKPAPSKGSEAAKESPVVIDDERRKELQVAYEAFVDFYEAEDLTAQAEIIDKLLTVLANIKKPSDATMKKFARSKKEALEEAEGDAPTTPKLPPKNIASLKTAIRVFRRDIRKLIDLTKKAERLTAKNLLVGNEIREKLRNFVEKIQKNIIRLNKHIKMLLTTPEKKDKEEKEEETLQEDKIGEYKKKMEAVEKVHDFILSGNGLGDIMTALIDPDADDPGWPEIKDKVDQALKQLKTIKGFFPSLVPFEGSEVKNSEMVSSLKKALKDFNLEASDLQTLGDTLAGEADIYVVQEFQTRLKEFSDQLKRIFGVSGIPDEDVVDKEEIAAPDEPDKVDPRAGTITPGRSDFIVAAKKKYDTNHELFDPLTAEEEEDLLAFLGALDYESPRPVQESEEGERGPENIQAAVGDDLRAKLEKVPEEIMAKALKILNDKNRLKSLESLILQTKRSGEEQETEEVVWASAQDVKKWINLNIFTSFKTKMSNAGIENKEDKRSLLLLIVSIIAFDPNSNLRKGEIVNEILGFGDKKQQASLDRPTKRVLSFMGIDTSEAPEFVRSLKPLKTGIIQWLIQWMKGGEIGLKYKLMRDISKKLKGYKFDTEALTKSIVKSLKPDTEAKAERQKIKAIENWISKKARKLLNTKGISLEVNDPQGFTANGNYFLPIDNFEIDEENSEVKLLQDQGTTQSFPFEELIQLIDNKEINFKGTKYKFVYGRKAKRKAEKDAEELKKKKEVAKQKALSDLDNYIESFEFSWGATKDEAIKLIKSFLEPLIKQDLHSPVFPKKPEDADTLKESMRMLERDELFFMFKNDKKIRQIVADNLNYFSKEFKDKKDDKSKIYREVIGFFSANKDKFSDILEQSLWSKIKKGVSKMFGKSSQQENLEKALRPLIEKLMRGE